MKKTILALLVLGTSVTFTSCKKDQNLYSESQPLPEAQFIDYNEVGDIKQDTNKAIDNSGKTGTEPVYDFIDPIDVVITDPVMVMNHLISNEFHKTSAPNDYTSRFELGNDDSGNTGYITEYMRIGGGQYNALDYLKIIEETSTEITVESRKYGLLKIKVVNSIIGYYTVRNGVVNSAPISKFELLYGPVN